MLPKTHATKNPAVETIPEFFNYDAYLENAAYFDVVNQSFRLSYSPPTMTTPDGQRLYLASLDIDVAIDDTKFLLTLLDMILDRIRSEIGHFNWSCRRVARLETDYLAVWELLDDANVLPEDYEFPEYYLELAWRDRKPVIRHTRDIPAANAQ